MMCFGSIKEYITVSVKIEKNKEKNTKKIKKEDELVQKYLEETYNLIEDLSENEIRNRATKRVDNIFKMEKEKRLKNSEGDEIGRNLN